MSTFPLKICNVSYLNSAPYRALRTLPGTEYLEAPPGECARMLLEGEVDLALIPVAEYIQRGGLAALPFGIAANGPVESVVLFANEPIDSLSRIRVDATSHTSVALLRVLLDHSSVSEHGSKGARRIPFYRLALPPEPPILASGEGLLAIGDRCLRLHSAYTCRYDLSAMWLEQTGHPFLFAVWAHRPGALTEEQRDAILAQCELGVGARQIFAREFADDASLHRADAEAYIEHRIAHRITPEICAGAQEFLVRGQALGIFPATREARSVWSFDITPGNSLAQSSRPAGNGSSAVNGMAVRRPTEMATRRSVPLLSQTLTRLLERAAEGARLSVDDGLLLAENASPFELGLAADRRRAVLHPEGGVSYIIDRNINYTNVCNVYCRFCAFYRAPEIPGRPSAKSKGGYVLTKEELAEKIEETIAAGGIQILLQGGLNPELGIEYYEDLFSWIKANYDINLHALSADEILHISAVSRLSLDETFDRLIAAGLGSLPGAGAELLVDRVRRRIARLKSPSSEWLEVHRVAHRKGLISTCTMLFGVGETWEDRLLHMLKLRELQDETRGFTAFITWPFQDENTKLKRGDTSAVEYLRVQSVARLFLDNIPNIQSSWVTMGPSLGQAALFFGANDFGSVMFEENVVSAAGTTFCMNGPLIERHIREAGFVPWPRNVHYERVTSSFA